MNTQSPTNHSPAASSTAFVPIVVSTEQATTAPPRVQRPNITHIWGTPFAQLTMEQTIALADEVVQARKPEYFVTANINYLMLCEDHPRLAEVNKRSMAVIADGQPIVSRSRHTKHPLPTRVAGSDLIVELANLSAQRGYRMYFLGAAPGVAQAAATELKRRFPDLRVAGCMSPPFRPVTAAEHAQMLDSIRAAGTDILLVAFGQPKGEFWIYDNLHELGVPLSIQLGASFDFLAGTARRAPAAWQRLGCEWLYRALSDPRRLGPRYLRNIGFLFRKRLGDLFSRGGQPLSENLEN
ncbi:MAG: WecB/TagA/CpsF family glycosyltransferase [Pirellulaceae bacterium]